MIAAKAHVRTNACTWTDYGSDGQELITEQSHGLTFGAVESNFSDTKSYEVVSQLCGNSGTPIVFACCMFKSYEFYVHVE